MSDDVYASRYSFAAEAIAACRLVSEPGDEIVVHAEDCEIDEEDRGCTCEPLVIVAGEVPRA